MNPKTIQKYGSKSVAKLILIATKHFNAYIRKRDSLESYFVCISCQKSKALSQMHAGHYYSAGHHQMIRFDEDNVHSQCLQCNLYKHGNLINYGHNLLAKIGQKRLLKLHQKVGIERRNGYKWDRFLLIEIIEKYK